MSRIPRLLPLAGVAVVGVLAVNALAGAGSLPELFSGARAWAEGKADAETPADKPAAAPKTAPAAAVCAPTAAELAKEAGLSPSELRVLQNLGDRRGELDAREQGLDVQLQLIGAAEAKLDAKFKALDGLKGEIKGLLGEADAQQEKEITRLVAVYSAMKPKDAAAQMRLMDDSVLLPIASRMKERTLAAILAQMPPAEAKAITEKLAGRYSRNAAILEGREAIKPEGAKVAEAPTAPAPAGKTPAAPAGKAPGAAPAPKGKGG
ncbi:MAG: MotE family protein [Caulobacter sp.]